jgi:hypothetical protein
MPWDGTAGPIGAQQQSSRAGRGQAMEHDCIAGSEPMQNDQEYFFSDILKKLEYYKI